MKNLRSRSLSLKSKTSLAVLRVEETLVIIRKNLMEDLG